MTSARAPVANLREGEMTLAADVSHHLIRVLRLEIGDHFTAFDPESKMEGDAVVIDERPNAARVRISLLSAAKNVASTDLVLIYALAKGDKIDAVVRDATELGATCILLTQTARSVVNLKNGDDANANARAENKKERWKRIVDQAARQCGRADPPSVDGVFAWSDALDRAAARCDARFCLDPRGAEPLSSALTAAIERKASMAFAIGPEGGLSADEIEIAVGKGFLPVSIGPFVLRTETVAAAVLGAVRILSS